MSKRREYETHVFFYTLHNNLDIRIANIIQDEESNMSLVFTRALSFSFFNEIRSEVRASPVLCVFHSFSFGNVIAYNPAR